MKYVSTRGQAPVLEFEDVMLSGLARDGGLYVPETWPTFSAEQIEALRGCSYQEIAFQVMFPFVSSSIDETEFKELINEAYSGFSHRAVAPLVQMDDNLWLLELISWSDIGV